MAIFSAKKNNNKNKTKKTIPFISVYIFSNIVKLYTKPKAFM